MIDLKKRTAVGAPEPRTMTSPEANAHLVQLTSQLAVLRAWQEANPQIADYRVTGMIESITQAVKYARALATGGHVPGYEAARQAALDALGLNDE